MSEETRSVEEIRRGWNKPAENTGVSTLVGEAARDGGSDGSDGDSEYADWSKQELKDEAESRGLAKSGSVKELVARLEEHDAEQGDGDGDPDGEGDGDGDDPDA